MKSIKFFQTKRNNKLKEDRRWEGGGLRGLKSAGQNASECHVKKRAFPISHMWVITEGSSKLGFVKHINTDFNSDYNPDTDSEQMKTAHAGQATSERSVRHMWPTACVFETPAIYIAALFAFCLYSGSTGTIYLYEILYRFSRSL